MPPGLQDTAVQHLGHARRIAHFFLIGDHVGKQRHLLDFLKTTHPDGLVRRLRRHQQQGRVVPIGCLHGRDEIGDPRPVLGDHHAHLAAGAGIAIRHHPARAFMRAIPERDARLREQVRNRHEGRSDDAKGMFNAMHLQDFDKGLFGGHAHRVSPHSTRSALGPLRPFTPAAPASLRARASAHLSPVTVSAVQTLPDGQPRLSQP